MEVLLESKVALAVFSAVSGVVLTVITSYILNKRAVFGYNVYHNRIGVTANDAIYGSVKVSWNDAPVDHLYLSTVEIKNESMKDFESVKIRVFTNDTVMLTQRTEISGTTRLIEFSKDYQDKINVPPGEQPSSNQFELYQRQRDFEVPTMNRGQVLKFEFLNAAKSQNQPTLWVDILHKGVVCKIKKPVNMVLGVSQPHALATGTMFAILSVILIMLYVDSIIIAALASFIIGYLVILPGVVTIKVLQKLKEALAG